MNCVAVVAGMRTPFVKSGKAFKDLGPLRLARESVRALRNEQGLDAEAVESLVFGVVVPERGKPNLAREIVFEEELPSHIEAQTMSSYCITGLRTIASVWPTPSQPAGSRAVLREGWTLYLTRIRARSKSRRRGSAWESTPS